MWPFIGSQGFHLIDSYYFMPALHAFLACLCPACSWYTGFSHVSSCLLLGGSCPPPRPNPWILFSLHAWDRKVSESLRKETHRSLTPVRPSPRGRSGLPPGFPSPGTLTAAAPRSLQGIVQLLFSNVLFLAAIFPVPLPDISAARKYWYPEHLGSDFIFHCMSVVSYPF